MAEVERVGHLSGRGGGAGVLQGAQLGGGELLHRRRPHPADPAALLHPRTHTGPGAARIGQVDTVQVGPARGQHQQRGLRLHLGAVAVGDQRRDGTTRQPSQPLQIEHTFTLAAPSDNFAARLRTSRLRRACVRCTLSFIDLLRIG
ncbi:MAG: hypothetical protein JWN06_2788 [Propionibacteriaceae bacterium]|nr:hypothetical protein [Propionibacteriaceae bacterium]